MMLKTRGDLRDACKRPGLILVCREPHGNGRMHRTGCGLLTTLHRRRNPGESLDGGKRCEYHHCNTWDEAAGLWEAAAGDSYPIPCGRCRPDPAEPGLSDADAHCARGALRAGRGRHAGALADYGAALGMEPGHAAAHAGAGTAHASMGNHRAAAECFDGALAAQPDLIDALFGRARALRALRRYDEAVEDYHRILKEDPGNVEAHVGLGLALADQDNNLGAVYSLNRALALSPCDTDALYHKGTILEHAGEYEEALTCLTAARRAGRDDALVHNGIGNALHDLGHHGEAVKSYDMALERDPEFSVVKWNRDAALAAERRQSEAGGQ